MNPHAIFRQYRAERRTQAYEGFKLEVLPHLSRYVAEPKGAGGFVAYAEMSPDSVTAAIEEQIAFFDQHRQDFEWKVYDFDPPVNLREILGRCGFVQRDEEAFMVLDPAAWQPTQRTIAGLTIERITDPRQLRDFVAAEHAIWPDEDNSWHVQKYANELARDPSAVSIYCAYVDQRPVGTGRVSFPRNSSFAELNGGGVISSMRGAGIFTALLTQRIDEARARGYRWLAVDAAPMSRPILLRKGFQHVCWTYPMHHRFRPGTTAS